MKLLQYRDFSAVSKQKMGSGSSSPSLARPRLWAPLEKDAAAAAAVAVTALSASRQATCAAVHGATSNQLGSH